MPGLWERSMPTKHMSMSSALSKVTLRFVSSAMRAQKSVSAVHPSSITSALEEADVGESPALERLDLLRRRRIEPSPDEDMSKALATCSEKPVHPHAAIGLQAIERDRRFRRFRQKLTQGEVL